MKFPLSPALCLLTMICSLWLPAISHSRTAPWDIEQLPSAPAPAFSLADLEGKTISSTTLKGQVLLINFWATWCAPCRQEMPALDSLHKEFKGKGLTVIGISIDSDLSPIKEFIAGAKTSFQILHDPEMKCHDTYKVFAYPTTFLVDRQGIIQKYWLGPQEWNSEEFKQTLQKYLQ